MIEQLALEITPSKLSEIPHEMIFNESEDLTLGVEIELQLIDDKTLDLTPKGGILLDESYLNPKIKQEFYLSTIEVITDICGNTHEAKADLKRSLRHLDLLGKSLGIKYASTGCHPFAKYSDCIISPTQRYYELIDRNQWLTRRMTVFGMHVHLGMKNGDECIRFNNFFMHFMPHLLALSSSSPFWQGNDTGLASCRPTTYEALPTAGQPYCVKNWRGFENLYHTLIKSEAIKSLKDLWWDIRPSPAFGTLEIRVCDGLATLDETMALVAFIHLLAHWFRDNGDWIDQVQLPESWMSRENKWRVMRYGLNAEIIISGSGNLKLIKQDILDWLQKLSPYIIDLKYEEYMLTIMNILERGTSTQRQRQQYQLSQSLEKVVLHNILEFENGSPNW
ncbi:YbdK family carboxylate-amine ligase [Candidatus Berkiella aquae]|uniref:Putative glutamate--cysteine ligase 2 n=1 Tax=Candidatus Berkiella aquae TaxID=295108 RepID=A0A0Q9YY56_9GAMM|nr:YbdK family carboxylate-amine ligase [Candidatus Berkiella aquae]MCS5711599.1 YbdK family carboxylate-amine ligase [Candidatus Berkiella aquae]